MTWQTQEPACPHRQPSDRAVLAGFLLFNLLFRLALLGRNAGEYTDGIIQLTQFSRTDSFWPPLYALLAGAVHRLGPDLLLSGRLVSLLAAVALVLPLWQLARAWGGRRAALFALAFYTVSPLPLRWSLRVMTDMPFLLFFQLACTEGLLARAADPAGPEPARRLVRATLWGVLATLTRYQGLMLAPLALLAAADLWRRRANGRGGAAAVQAAWVALPAWLLFHRFGHLAQVAERSDATPWLTLLHYWDLFEMFAYILPYALTPPVFVFFLLGLFRRPGPASPREGACAPRSRPCVPGLLLYVAGAVLAAQSVFQSFQTRYLLPLLPLLLVFAGAGMARTEAWFLRPGGRRPRARRRILPAVAALALLWPLAFGLASCVLQRGAFGDLFAAGARLRSLPPGVRIYSNETFKPGMNGIKLAFAAGRPVELIPELGDPAGRMAPGSVVALHSAYGGMRMQGVLLDMLRARYRMTPLADGLFEARVVPLFPDVMQEPGSHQNPLAWALRYQPQEFRTLLWRIEEPAGPEALTPPPRTGSTPPDGRPPDRTPASTNTR